MNCLRSLVVVACALGALLPVRAARAEWVSQGYWVIDQPEKIAGRAGTAVSWSAGSGGGTVTANSDGQNECGARVRFGHSWYWDGQGQYYALYVSIIGNTLDGSAASGAYARAGVYYSPYVSVTKDTRYDGNPFSIAYTSPRTYYAFEQGSGMVIEGKAWCTPTSGGSSSASALVKCSR
jgi:hypothetical protein